MGHQVGYAFKTAGLACACTWWLGRGEEGGFNYILGWSLEKYSTSTVEDADDNVDNDDRVS